MFKLLLCYPSKIFIELNWLQLEIYPIATKHVLLDGHLTQGIASIGFKLTQFNFDIACGKTNHRVENNSTVLRIFLSCYSEVNFIDRFKVRFEYCVDFIRPE